MPNVKHIDILLRGVAHWNQWRIENPSIKPNLSGENLANLDLSEANLSESELYGVALFRSNLHKANLHKANLNESILYEADLRNADLHEADLSRSDLTDSDLRGANLKDAELYIADLSGANLSDSNLNNANLYGARLIGSKLIRAILNNANLSRANLTEANLNHANLDGAGLIEAVLVDTDLSGANLSNCRIYGISAWNVTFNETIQTDLIITKVDQPIVTVDEMEVAQFVYLVLNNSKLRKVIDTVTTKSVLILGRFTIERKVVLDAIREKLRQLGYVPILFDFEKPDNRDLTETVGTLASLSRFVIADLSDPSSIGHELMSFATALLSVPISPIFSPKDQVKKPYAMFEHLSRYPHVLPIHRYDTADDLIADLLTQVIEPAESRVIKMRPSK